MARREQRARGMAPVLGRYIGHAMLAGCVLLAPAAAAAQGAAAQHGSTQITRADSLYAAGEQDAARGAYEAALREDPTATRALYQLAQLAGRGSLEQIALLRRYTELEAGDAWGHLAYADALLSSGRPHTALRSYERGLALEPGDEDLSGGAQRARQALRPVLEPLFGASGDSDENRVLTGGAALMMVMRGDLSVGVRGIRTGSRGLDGESAAATSLRLSVANPAPSSVRVMAAAGVVRYDAFAGAATTPVGSLLLRAPVVGRGRAELRAERSLLTATPQLMGNGVVVNETRGSLTLPLMGPLALRGLARLGDIRSDVEDANRRIGYGGGVAAALTPLLELSLNAQRLRYERSTRAGYFAPARADLVELGLSVEHYPGQLALAVDAGAGAQRVERHGEQAGRWSPALRVWGSLATSTTARVQLGVELDAERSQLNAPAGGSGDWQYGRFRVFLRHRL
jgi:hypothetical protein